MKATILGTLGALVLPPGCVQPRNPREGVGQSTAASVSLGQPGRSEAATKDLVRDVELHVGEDADGLVRVVVEIPAFTREKWETDFATGQMAQDTEDGQPRVIRYAAPYLVNYGMFPQTLGGDGDPLDAVLLGGSYGRAEVAEGHVIGVLRMMDVGEVDDKILVTDPRDPYFGNVADLPSLEEGYPGYLGILSLWFKNYKLLPQSIEIGKSEGREEALKILDAGHQRFLESAGKTSPPQRDVPRRSE